MKDESIKNHLPDIQNFVVNYKKAHLIHFLAVAGIFLMLLITAFCNFNEFCNNFVLCFKQIGSVVSPNILVVISLLLFYFISLYFLIYALISIFRKDKTKFLVLDVVASFIVIIASALFVHGTDELNILSIIRISIESFKEGSVGFGIRYLLMFILTVFLLLMAFVYSLDRLIYRERKIRIFLSVKEYPFGVRFWKPDEAKEAQLYKFAYHRQLNFVRIMDNLKVITEDMLNHEVHLLIAKINETTLLTNPQIVVKIKYGFKVFKKELINNRDFSFGLQNGYYYIKDMVEDILA